MHALRSILVMLMALAGFAVAASDTCATCDSSTNAGAACESCGPHIKLPHAPDTRGVAGSTSYNYCTDFERVKAAAIEALEEEAHVSREKIEESGDEGCSSCGEVVYLKAPYIDFSRIKVKIDGRGKNSGMPDLSVTITTDKTFFTRHKEWEQRIHELVLLKLQAKQHGAESHVAGIVKASTQPTTPPAMQGIPPAAAPNAPNPSK